MKIVLDSNIFFSDFFLTAPDTVLLRYYIKRHKAQLLIPEIIFEEVINLYREELSDAISKVSKIERLVNKKIDLKIDTSEQADFYKDLLKKKLKSFNAHYLSYLDVSQKVLADKAIQKQKPFSASGNGYRDALIWESILLDAEKSKSPYIFISKNTGDFASSAKDDFHQDLKDELKKRKISNTFTYYASLKEFIEKVIKPTFSSLDIIASQIEESEYEKFGIDHFIEENRVAIQDEINARLGDSERKGVESISTYWDLEKGSYEIADAKVYQMEGDEKSLYINFDIEWETTLEGFLYKGDYPSADEKISIIDNDWNEHYFRVQFYDMVPLHFEVIINEQDGKITSYSISIADESD